MQQEQQQTQCLKCQQNVIDYILKQYNFKQAQYICKQCWEKQQQQQSLYITLKEYKQLLENQLKQQESYAIIQEYVSRLDTVTENIKRALESVRLLKNKLCESFSNYQKLQQLIEGAKTQIDRQCISMKEIIEIQNLLTNFQVIEDDQIKWSREIEMHEQNFYNYQFFTPNYHSDLPIEQIKSNIKIIKNPDFQKIIEQRIIKDKADHPICFNTLPVDKGIVNDGNIYFGQKYKGKKQGLGLFLEQQNKIKFGYFINDKFTWGQMFIQKDNQFNHLCGFFDNDLIQGEGYWELIENNKIQRYQGNFLNGLKNGQGHLEDLPTYYKGQWENDEFHGQGEYYDGNLKYEGRFERGQKQNQFIVTDQFGSQSYKKYNQGKELTFLKKS